MLKWLYNICIGNGCIHNWNKWKRCEINKSSNTDTSPNIHSGQVRICNKCGKHQLKEI